MIDEDEYNQLYREIKGIDDVERLSKRYSREFLFEILTLKLGRETKKKFYKLPRKKLVREWKHGKSFVDIAKEYEFSPVIMAYIILQEMGYSKKRSSAIINKKVSIENKRVKDELENAWKSDPVYSPEGIEKQYERGDKGEDRIKKWLDKRMIKYLREDDLKKKYPKTPDFLLAKVIRIYGEPIRWIESKYSIGDMEKVKYDYRRQLDQYLHLFGPGAIVYHLGLLPSAKEWLERKGILALERMPRIKKVI